LGDGKTCCRTRAKTPAGGLTTHESISTPGSSKIKLFSFSSQELFIPTPMPALQASIARGQKRKRPLESDRQADSTPEPQPPRKRAGFRSAEEANTAFWDNISKVPLCPSALKELDRRTAANTRRWLSKWRRRRMRISCWDRTACRLAEARFSCHRSKSDALR
jgi:hypothetical protein